MVGHHYRGGDAIYSSLCQLNGFDMLDSKFNKGTLDLEPELRDHFLYSDIWEAIQNYNTVYGKCKRREGNRPQSEAPNSRNVVVTSEGHYLLKGDGKEGGADLLLDQDSKEVMIGLDNALKEEVWPALQAAKEDLTYEFQVLMGTIVGDCDSRPS